MWKGRKPSNFSSFHLCIPGVNMLDLKWAIRAFPQPEKLITHILIVDFV